MRYKSGLTILEVLLSLGILSILFLGSFRVAFLQRDVLESVEQTNEAMLALESMRNFVLEKISETGSISEDDLQQIANKFVLSAPLKWKWKNEFEVGGVKRRLLQLTMTVHVANHHFARRYIREVVLP